MLTKPRSKTVRASPLKRRLPLCPSTNPVYVDSLMLKALIRIHLGKEEAETQLVSWCFEPSQPRRITSGLNTNFTLSPSHSFYKSLYHKSCFFSLFIFCGHSTQEPVSSRVTNFILQAYTRTSVSNSQHRKKSGEVLEKMQVNGPER